MESKENIDINEQIESLRTSLLDMNMRNNLLNFKSRKHSIKIVDENIAELYDILVINKDKMRFLSNEKLDEDSIINDTWDVNSLVKDSHKDLYLQTNYDNEELRKRLNKLYNDNKTILEEQGYNSLYIALGFLEWNDVNYQDTTYEAPLILIPMEIRRESLTSPVQVLWNYEEIRYNISLEIKLKDQGVILPSFDDIETKEELNEYLIKVEDTIKSKSNWRIVNDIYIDNFNFKKMVMYKDLDLKNWNNIQNNAVKNLFEVTESSSDYDEDEIQKKISSMHSSEIFNVIDADSSQVAVINEVNKNKNLVVEGPPGTGKSQTIINIIAELMANDKKVLFVSEKKAALDVVKSRLDAIGLGDGCLELYGKNSNKKKFLNELKRVLNLNSIKLKNKGYFDKLDSLKEDLNNYVEDLHSLYGKTELTNYRLIGILEYHTQILDKNKQFKYRFEMNNVSNLTKEDRQKIINNLELIQSNYELIRPYKDNIWLGTNFKNLTSSDSHIISEYLMSIITYYKDFDDINENISSLTGIEKLKTFEIENYIKKLKILKPNLKLLKDNNLPEIIEEISKFQNIAKSFGLNISSKDFDLHIDDLFKEYDILRNKNTNEINFNTLSSNYLFFYDENDLMKVIGEINKFISNSKDLNIENYSLDNINLNDLNYTITILSSIIDFLDSDFYFMDKNDLKSIFNDFKEFKLNSWNTLLNDLSKFKLNSKYIKLTILDLNLDSIKSDVINIFNQLNDFDFDYRNITDRSHFEKLISNFKINKEFIENSNIQALLDDSDLQNKLNIFQKGKDSFFKRTFNGNYKNISNQFHQYYSSDVDNERIVEDINKLVSVNNELSNLRSKILAYSNTNMDDNKIIVESKRLLSLFDELDDNISKLNNYNVNTSVQSLDKDIDNLLYIKDLKDKIMDENSNSVFELNTINNSLNDFQSKIVFNVLNHKYDNLLNMKDLLNNIKNNNDECKYYFNDIWNSYSSSCDKLNNHLDSLNDFKKYYDLNIFNDDTVNFVEETYDFDKLSEYVSKLKDIKLKIFDLYKNIDKKLNLSNKISVSELNSVNLSEFFDLINLLYNNIDKLHSLRLFIDYCNKFSDKNTEKLIELIKNDKIKPNLFVNVFYFNFANNALNHVFDEEYSLKFFNYKTHEEEIQKFKNLDKQTLEINRYRVKEVLSKRRPNINNIWPRSSPMGILKREFTKKKKIMPIRKLLTQSHKVISAIKPCFMMSPVSIAQYLPPEYFESYFDYVIFDEASQVEVADAIGAMMRGKHYIVMGDTKQLPPTRFFEATMSDDDENIYDNIKNFESILHLCENSFTRRILKWHYRSRHDSLISFSNIEFYNNDLYVFPSPMKKSEDLGLKFMYDPTAFYEIGSKNTKEAENIIDYAIECFKKYGTSKSLGIATFSIKQKQVVMDVLDEKLKEHPEYVHFFNDDGNEGFFIKNLENIQGDERDIILISVGYGKNEVGKFNLNFGPLNKEGGEKRLNVLITRAREKCVIFANFKSSDIHEDRVRSKGVKVFKNFLYYAETGDFPVNYHTGKDFDSEFEKSVYNFLVDNGYDVEKQVGCAKYRIDLAIVNPENQDNYVLGIECDGSIYHSSRVARDRDRLRQQVLEGLGWKFHRIWSTDWYHTPVSAKKRLLNAVEDAISNKSNNMTKDEKESFNLKNNIIYESNEDKLVEKRSKYFEDYDYYLVNANSEIKQEIYNMICKESPVYEKEIYDRIKVLNGNKATKKFKNNVTEILSNLALNGLIKCDKNFYYNTEKDLNSMKIRKRVKPNINLIYDKEIKLAICVLSKINLSISKKELIKEVANNFGFNRVTSKVKEEINQNIKELINLDVIISEVNGNLTLNNEVDINYLWSYLKD